jgi:nucleoid-associated protein YgaU
MRRARAWLVFAGAATATATAAAGAGSVAAAGPREHVVRSGETLWSIAARRDVYGDPYLWPVIYKFNRDQIQDPARVYPGQRLVLPLEVDAETRAAARVEAGAAPELRARARKEAP